MQAVQASGDGPAQDKIHSLLWAMFKVEVDTEGKVTPPDPNMLKNDDPQGQPSRARSLRPTIFATALDSCTSTPGLLWRLAQ
jgi:hypothetical protein